MMRPGRRFWVTASGSDVSWSRRSSLGGTRSLWNCWRRPWVEWAYTLWSRA